MIYVESDDAGAFFRFSDIYPKIFGGEMWVAMDPQSADQAPQDGILNIRDFVGARRSRRSIASPAQPAGQPQTGVEFSRLRVDFTRSLGRFAIKEGLVRGPVIGATVDGYIDYMREDVRMRGTFVPLYGLNNMFGQIPIFGLFLRRQQRGPARRDLRGGRPAERAGAARQSDLGGGAGPAAQVLRVPDHQRARAAELRRSQPRLAAADISDYSHTACREHRAGLQLHFVLPRSSAEKPAALTSRSQRTCCALMSVMSCGPVSPVTS